MRKEVRRTMFYATIRIYGFYFVYVTGAGIVSGVDS